MWKSTKTVALEQHMDAITVAVAAPGRQPPEFCGDVPSTPEAVRKLVGRLDDGKMDLRGGAVWLRAVPAVDDDGLRLLCGGAIAVAAAPR